MIFFPSRDRVEVLRKTLPSWLDAGAERYGITILVEAKERYAYAEMARSLSPDIKVQSLKKRTGVAQSRQLAFKTAYRAGLRSFLISDDDVRMKDDPGELLRQARRKNVLGVGAYFSIYGLVYGIQPYTGTWMLKNSWMGYACYALNVRNMRKIGGYDSTFVGTGQLDQGTAIKGITELGILWRICTDVQASRIIKERTPNSGGIDTMIKKMRLKPRDELRHEWHKLAYHRYPEYVNDPRNCKKRECKMRYNWRKMIAENCDVDDVKGKVIKV